MRSRILFSILAIALVSGLSSARADSRLTSLKEPNCPMRSDATISLSFNSTEKDVSQVKAWMDGKIEEVKTLATTAGITSFEFQSMSYSINSTNNGGGCMANGSAGAGAAYQVYGNAGFKIEPENKAGAFMDQLSKKGFTANLNVNAYKQCQ